MSEPRTSRPGPPGYGIPKSAEGLLPWSWARQRLQEAETYWVASVRSDGRPHLMPTWGAWVDDRFYFEGGRETARWRNITANPKVAISVESGDDFVIVEGTARDIAPPGAALARLVLPGFDKYKPTKGYQADAANWDSPEGALWELQPRRAFGWGDYPRDATRWDFD